MLKLALFLKIYLTKIGESKIAKKYKKKYNESYYCLRQKNHCHCLAKFKVPARNFIENFLKEICPIVLYKEKEKSKIE